jgi:hypothetical protein
MDTLAFDDDDDDDTFRVDSDVSGTTNYDRRECGGVYLFVLFTHTHPVMRSFSKKGEDVRRSIGSIDSRAPAAAAAAVFFFNRAFHEKTKKNAREDESITREG